MPAASRRPRPSSEAIPGPGAGQARGTARNRADGAGRPDGPRPSGGRHRVPVPPHCGPAPKGNGPLFLVRGIAAVNGSPALRQRVASRRRPARGSAARAGLHDDGGAVGGEALPVGPGVVPCQFFSPRRAARDEGHDWPQRDPPVLQDPGVPRLQVSYASVVPGFSHRMVARCSVIGEAPLGRWPRCGRVIIITARSREARRWYCPAPTT
jgi:hypothetical protein